MTKKKTRKEIQMNDKTQKEALDSMETEVVAKIECNNCCDNLEESSDTEEDAKHNLLKQIEQEEWYVGKAISEEYGAEFNVLCPTCLKDVIMKDLVREESVKEKMEKKFAEMV